MKHDNFILHEDEYLKTIAPNILPKHVLDSAPRLICGTLAQELQELGIIGGKTNHKENETSLRKNEDSILKEKLLDESDEKLVKDVDALSLFADINETAKVSMDTISSADLLPEEMTLIRVLRLRNYLSQLAELDNCPIAYREETQLFELTQSIEGKQRGIILESVEMATV